MKINQDLILENFAQLTAALNSALGEQRAIAHNAIDMEDWIQGQEMLKVANQNISVINSWKSRLNTVKAEMTSSLLFSETLNSVEGETTAVTAETRTEGITEQTNTVINKDEYIEYEQLNNEKIGKYVRHKMRELVASGYTFSEKQIDEMSTKSWSANTFHSNGHEFFRRYDDSAPIGGQLKGSASDAHYRFWDEIFVFGNDKVLISSQWYENQRMCFDEWYTSLKIDVLPEIQVSDNHEDKPITDNGANTVEIESRYVFVDEFHELQNELETVTQMVKEPISDFICTPQTVLVCNNEYTVQSWEDVIINVCEHMVLTKPYVMALIDKYEPHFIYNESEARNKMDNPRRLSNGIWVETGGNKTDISVLSYNVISLCGYSQSDFIIK